MGGNTVLGKSNGQNFQKYPRKQIIYSEPQTTTNSVSLQEMNSTTSQIYQPIPTTIPKQLQSSFDRLKGRLDQAHYY